MAQSAARPPLPPDDPYFGAGAPSFFKAVFSDYDLATIHDFLLAVAGGDDEGIARLTAEPLNLKESRRLRFEVTLCTVQFSAVE